ncbi:hypothetical protein AO385_0826 [Moraxella catarrhalis]|uniref:Uncharacterized protein n=1 Tax=Moraxella catarrhalis TaxID=480 RepID=A0A198UPZ0_MORCA|nr:hypothetical protein AO384_0100 [Moraxella catarrhalis]OAU98595.1 hypothetical protein AO383_0523 [Moraxella catarrhalis]OAV02845.1 hypothetical protein AO385_0826 [Moraxella catarrhalis]
MYADLKSQANNVANNKLLLDWSVNSKNYSHEAYNIMVNNLRHYIG